MPADTLSEESRTAQEPNEQSDQNKTAQEFGEKTDPNKTAHEPGENSDPNKTAKEPGTKSDPNKTAEEPGTKSEQFGYARGVREEAFGSGGVEEFDMTSVYKAKPRVDPATAAAEAKRRKHKN